MTKGINSLFFFHVMPLLPRQVCRPFDGAPKECVFVNLLGFQIAFHMPYMCTLLVMAQTLYLLCPTFLGGHGN
jgi:hypothetical protein